MKRQGFSLIEVIIALTLLSILVLAMLPVLTSSALQLRALEELRMQNQFTRNLIVCVQKDVPLRLENSYVLPTEGIEGEGSNTFHYRGIRYTVSGERSGGGLYWYRIEREGMSEPIRILQTE